MLPVVSQGSHIAMIRLKEKAAVAKLTALPFEAVKQNIQNEHVNGISC
jgi:hypothetical protein